MKAEKMMLSAGLFILRLAILILVIAGVCKVGIYTYQYCYAVVSDAPAEAEPGRDVTVTVQENMDGRKLAVLLERKGLVTDGQIFRIQLKVNGYEDKLKAGEYVLNSSMPPTEMMKILSGEAAEEGEEE